MSTATEYTTILDMQQIKWLTAVNYASYFELKFKFKLWFI